MSAFRLGKRVLPVVVRPHPTARRMSLRVDPREDRLLVVVPAGLPDKGQDAIIGGFLRSQADWISQRLTHLPDRVAFEPNAEIPFRGEPVKIVHHPHGRHLVRLSDGMITVGGPDAHIARRLTDFLRKQAKDILTQHSREHADTLGLTIGRVTIRDPRSRWGSCSPRGDLSYSWRLVMAPDDVIRYVTAHEVAHMVEFNHSSRFWAVVDRLVGSAEPARRWLATHGAALHRYGSGK